MNNFYKSSGKNKGNFAFQSHFKISTWKSTREGALELNLFDKREKRLRPLLFLSFMDSVHRIL
jgi:hypothetical protein